MNIPNFTIELLIDWNAVQDQVEIDVTHRFAQEHIYQQALHIAQQCPCNGGHCTILARKIGMVKKSHTKTLQKVRKDYKYKKLKQTILRKKMTSKEHPIEIPE